ncbi:AI-2 transport protein TqsA [Clostridium acetireducens DSM 10703]|uniref:AI-2 transport protein TqsA n=1 Tax=Clostridium acetireducens DSM 10703 TaxID=1121290 RepID=A0A1E8EY47_9CLOT|nr:AI-2 transport protein TqsA [Clostridium acetireducens DSM 10703]
MKTYKDKIKYFDLILAVVISFILIKLINNYQIFLTSLNKIISIISPFIFAFIIAYILNPLMKCFEKRFKLKRGISLLLTYVVIILGFSLFINYLLPKISSNLLDILKSIPQFATASQEWFNKILTNKEINNLMNYSGNFDLKPDFLISKASNILSTTLNALISKTLSFTNYFIKWVFGFIISIYILADKEKFIESGKRFIYIVLKEDKGFKFINFFKNLNYMIGLYIGTKAIDSSIIAILAFIGLTLLKSPYSLLIALIVGITNMIPYFGPFIGMVIGFIINVFFSPIKALFVLLFLFLLQQFDGWYLDPKLIGGKVGLSPFWIIFAVTLGGGLYGPIGMILAVPIMAVIKMYLDKFLLRYDKGISNKEVEKSSK